MTNCGKVGQIYISQVTIQLTGDYICFFLEGNYYLLEDLVRRVGAQQYAGLVFEVMCLMSVAYLSNTIYQMHEKK